MKTLREYTKPILAILVVAALAYLLFLRRPRQNVVVSVPETRGAPASREQDANNSDASPIPAERTYRIVTLLPPDAIPAIDNPRFYSADEADAEYDPEELVLGVSINGENKAYSTTHLDSHEIVNDTVGGRKIAVTW